MGGKASRDKGLRFERALVNAMNASDLEALRVPLSGSSRGFKGDIQFKERGTQRTMECKSKKKGWKDLYDYLDAEGIDRLAIKRDGREALIVIPVAAYLVLAGLK